MSELIPFSAPDIGDEEIAAVTAVLQSGWVTTGPESASFEREFANFVGGDVEAVAVNSATAGLHLALEACGVSPGDEVIVPTWTFTATAEVVRYLGATPVLVDIEAESLNISMSSLAAAITDRTKAVVVVHMAGLSVDMLELKGVLAGRPIKIIEDAAHAFPSRRNGADVGSAQYSDVAVFSFYANKTMTTGEGGMLTTRDPMIAARARVMRLHGIDRDVFDRYRSSKPSWAYDIVAPGYKYNLTDSAAAMGRVQLRRVAEMRSRRENIAQKYDSAFQDLGLDLPSRGEKADVHSWHLYIVRLGDSRCTRDEFIQAMAERQIGCSVHFIPLHMHTYWRESLGLHDSDFPIASREYERVVSLPLFSKMTERQVERVIDAVRDIIKS